MTIITARQALNIEKDGPPLKETAFLAKRGTTDDPQEVCLALAACFHVPATQPQILAARSSASHQVCTAIQAHVSPLKGVLHNSPAPVFVFLRFH